MAPMVRRTLNHSRRESAKRQHRAGRAIFEPRSWPCGKNAPKNTRRSSLSRRRKEAKLSALPDACRPKDGVRYCPIGRTMKSAWTATKNGSVCAADHKNSLLCSMEVLQSRGLEL